MSREKCRDYLADDFNRSYIAHCYPYTYSDLLKDLDSWEADASRQKFLRRRNLCETIAGNPCEILSISDTSNPAANMNRPIVIMTARVHPGESNSSWIMRGIIDFLTGSSEEAQCLRDKFDFRLVPMLNPDGVINGNYRCNLAGNDLNRRYKNPSPYRHPTVFYFKQLIRTLIKNNRSIFLYCDLHGHSIKNNVFAYGCDQKYRRSAGEKESCLGVQHPKAAQLFPFLLHKLSESFSFVDSHFQVQRSKDSTSRVVVWKEFGVDLSYTVEASFAGANARAQGSMQGYHFRTGSSCCLASFT